MFSQWPFHHLHHLHHLLQGLSLALRHSILLSMARAEVPSWALFSPSVKADWKKRRPTIAAIRTFEQHFLWSLVLIMCNLSRPSNQRPPRSDLQEWKDVLKLDCWEKQFSNISLPKSAADQRWWDWSVGYLCCYKGYGLGICILAVRFINWTWIFVVNNHTHSTTMFLTPIKSASSCSTTVMWCFQAAYNYLGCFSTERLFLMLSLLSFT